MKIGITTFALGGIASYLGLGPTLPEKFKAIKALRGNCQNDGCSRRQSRYLGRNTLLQQG
jgi:hypothetical protein